MQEIVLARFSKLVTCNGLVELDEIRSCMEIMMKAMSAHDQERFAAQDSESIARIHFLCYAARDAAVTPTLDKILTFWGSGFCAEERDKVYSLIGIDVQTRNIKVDYEQSKYAMALRIAVEVSLRLDIAGPHGYGYIDNVFTYVRSLAKALDVAWTWQCGICYLRSPDLWKDVLEHRVSH